MYNSLIIDLLFMCELLLHYVNLKEKNKHFNSNNNIQIIEKNIWNTIDLSSISIKKITFDRLHVQGTIYNNIANNLSRKTWELNYSVRIGHLNQSTDFIDSIIIYQFDMGKQ